MIFVSIAHLSHSILVALILGASGCRSHVPSIQISLPNGGTIYIFFHLMIGKVGSKVARVGRRLRILDGMNIRMSRELEAMNVMWTLLKT